MAALGAASIARTPEAMVHPVAWTLPRSAELACTARRALRWGTTRAGALPRGHFDHAAPTGLEAIALGLRSVVDEHITTDERLVPCQDEPVDPRLVRVRVGVWVRLNTCGTAGDGVCQDGGWKAVGSICEFGTDCIDCGSRLLLDAPPTSSVGAEDTSSLVLGLALGCLGLAMCCLVAALAASMFVRHRKRRMQPPPSSSPTTAPQQIEITVTQPESKKAAAPESLAALLAACGLEHHEKTFLDEGYTLDNLLSTMTQGEAVAKSDLRELKLTLGECRKLLNQLKISVPIKSQPLSF